MTPGSNAEQLGIKEGDIIAATSATAGDQLWMHNSADGVKSALNTRFVMSPTVTVRLERDLAKIPEDIVASLQVPYTFLVRLKRPIGLHVVEGPGNGVYVQYIKPDLGAARSKALDVGDQIVAMSASWGDRMWEVNNVESFVVGVRMRTDTQLSFKLKRMVPLVVYTGKSVLRSQRQERKAETKAAEAARSTGFTVFDQIEHIRTIPDLLETWQMLQAVGKVSQFSVNKIMSQALTLEDPGTAIDIFESTFGFDPDPARDLMRFLDDDSAEDPRPRRSDRVPNPLGKKDKWSSGGAPVPPGASALVPATLLTPNNFVCTTAAKAYGRRQQPDKALALLPWLEDQGEIVDVFFLSALLFVCAKAKRVADAERLFWVEVPKRNLTYTVATTNSLMYMYARTNRPDDALKVYELTKQLGLKCTVITYGVLIKALMSSGKRHLEDTSFEILRSLPDLGISPGIEVYNQFFERYAHTHNYRGTKMVLRLMSQAKPSVKPDTVTYGYLIACFAESKKPRSALAIFHQMRKRRVEPNAYTYMGVLKALSHMRDGLSAVQVIGEMRDKGVIPGNRHYAMAMFACVTANQCNLAESVFASYVRSGERPDTALYTLYMRALLQQGKWTEGTALFARMLAGKEFARPNHHTLNCIMQYQVLGGRFAEAQETLSLLLMKQPVVGSKRSALAMTSIEHTYRSLSFGLGRYSSQMQRMQREDQYHQARQGVTNKNGGLDLIGMINAGDASDRSQGQSNFFSAETMLSTPSPETLEFLVACIDSIGQKRYMLQVMAPTDDLFFSSCARSHALSLYLTTHPLFSSPLLHYV